MKVKWPTNRDLRHHRNRPIRDLLAACEDQDEISENEKNTKGNKLESLCGIDRSGRFRDSIVRKPLAQTKKSISSKRTKDDVPRLNVIKAILVNFAEFLDYRTYRPRRRSQYFDEPVASSVSNFVTRLQSRLKETEFEEIDLISKLTSLKKVRDACKSDGVHERAAMS